MITAFVLLWNPHTMSIVKRDKGFGIFVIFFYFLYCTYEVIVVSYFIQELERETAKNNEVDLVHV